MKLRRIRCVKVSSLIVNEYNGIRLSTTSNSLFKEVAQQLNVSLPDVVRPIPDALVCCPVVETALVQSFYICVNIVCKKKVTLYSGELTTTCQNPRCKRKMLLQRCKQAYLVELTLTNADGNQEIYTVFSETLEAYFETVDKQTIEDTLLQLSNVDFHVNQKCIIVKISQCQHNRTAKPANGNSESRMITSPSPSHDVSDEPKPRMITSPSPSHDEPNDDMLEEDAEEFDED